MSWPSFAGPAAAAFVAGLVIGGIALAAEVDARTWLAHLRRLAAQPKPTSDS